VSDPAIATASTRLARSWRLRIWALVAAALGAGLTRLPLFGVLGFEHALVVAVLASVVGLDLGATLARRLVGAVAPGLARAIAPWRLIAALSGRAIGLTLLITCIPGAIAAVHGIWAPTCDWAFGLRAYALLPLASGALAAAAGVAIALACGSRRWLSRLAPWLVLIALVIAGVWRFYAAPPVFSYSPIVGYFPGNLYDEDVGLGAALYWARAEQLAIVVAALAACAACADAPTLRLRWAARPRGWRIGELAVLALAATCAGALRWHAGALGYAVDAADIEDELDGVRRTAHFVIHYVHRPDIDADMDLIAADHEFRLAQVERVLGATLTAPIDSYYFPDADAKARWMGARGVEMAKPWRHEIYLNHEDFPHNELRHEIAHVVAGEFGDPWFSVSAAPVLGMPLLVNPGLIEGLAVAADWPGGYNGALTPHEQVRAMDVMGRTPSVDELFSLGFLSVSPARSYTTGGSFLRFLLERYGAAPMHALYETGGDFGAAYGQGQATLVGAWRTMLAGITLDPEAIEQVRERFRYPGMFARPCPHAIAARTAAAADALVAGDTAGAIALMRVVCGEEPDEPLHRLGLARALDAGDDAERAEAATIWTELAGDTARITSSLRARALEQLGRRAAAAGDWAGARALFARGAALPVEEDARRLLDGMVLAIDHRGLAAGALRGYFFGSGEPLGWATLITVTEPGLALGWYLRGLMEHARGDHATAARDLRRALDLDLPSRRFVRSATRRLLVSAWRIGDLATVGRAADILAGDGATSIDRLAADDWRDRLAWARTGALPRR
jgi:tetratricopeptide (TPR) repeat protein